MNSFQELIKRRRSTRKYTETPLTQDQVVDLLKAGLMAPTSKNTHSWQFIAVDDKEKNRTTLSLQTRRLWIYERCHSGYRGSRRSPRK